LQFDRTMHRAHSSDPHSFDLVLNSESLGLEIAAEIIVHAVEVGHPEGTATNPMLRSPSSRAPWKPEAPGVSSELWPIAGEPAAPPTPLPPPASPTPEVQALGPENDPV